MRTYLLLFALVALLCGRAFAQNLVVNPTFEQTTPMCPAPFPGACGALNSWDGFTGGAQPPNNWFNPTYCTPDYFSTCCGTPILKVPCDGLGALGYQQPRSGIVYGGFIAYESGIGGEGGWREYWQGQLSPGTTIGKEYELSMWVSRPNNCGFATDACGMVLTPNQITLTDSVPFVVPNPQLPKHTSAITDSVNWVKVCTTWVATDVMNWVTIGNFFPKNSPNFIRQSAPAGGGLPQPFAYYYLEDVSVIEVQPASVSAPVTICAGQSTTLTATGGSTGYIWTPGNLSGASVTVSPTQTTTYTVGIERACTITTMTVTVTVNAGGTIGGLPPTICNTGSPVTLTGTPAGGTFSGQGVSGNQFNPAGLPLGTYTVTYSGVNAGCNYSTTAQVTIVNNAPAVINAPTTYCSTGAPATLTATPAGGTFSGPGVSGTTFNPATAGVGTHTITYSGTSGCGPVNATLQVTVSQGTAVTFTPPTNACLNGTAISLATTVSPAGGTFSGPGISGSTFTPSTAGVGTHTLTYSVTGSCGTVSKTATITVTTGTVPTVNLNATYCVTDPVVTLAPNPETKANTFSGPGITNATWISFFGQDIKQDDAEFSPATAGVGTHTITYSGSNICTYSIVVTVLPSNPPVSITPVGNLCTGSAPVTLTATPAGGTFSGPGVSGGQFNPATAGNGTHTITYSGTGSCGSFSGTTTISVSAGSVSVSAAPTSICPGQSSTLTASGATSYTWAPNTGLSGTTGASVTASPNSTTTYTVTGTNAGCTATATVVVTVGGSISVTASANPTSICPGQSSTLTASGATSYTWAPNTGLSGTTGASVTATPNSTTTYTVTGTNAGCTGTATVMVTVGGSISVTATANPTTICSGQSVTLTASGATSYTWTGAALASTTGASVTANPTTNTTYTVTGNSSGCTGTATVTVTIQSAGTASIAGLPPTLCNNVSNPITLTGTPAGGVFTGLGIITGNTFNPNGLAPGVVTVTYTVTGNCGQLTATANVTIQDNPAASISGLPASLCPQDPAVTLSGTPAGGTFSGAGVSGNQFNPNGLTNGNYTVTYTANGPCGAVTATATVSIQSNPTASINAVSPLCTTDAPITLTGSPAGGSFSGPGVSGTTFNPATAGAGAHNITYSGSGACGSFNASISISVTANPTATITPVSTLCNNGNPATLSATPAGGTFSGAGVTGNQFNPNGLTAGNYTITYSGTSGACNYSTTTQITVQAEQTLNISPISALCNNSAAVTLSATPAGGTFSGTGVTGNQFNPNGLTAGNYVVNYSVNGNCGVLTGSITITVQSNSSPAISGLPASLCDNAGAVTLSGTPAGGTFSGAGVTGNQFNPNGLTAGNYTVTYAGNGLCGAFSTSQDITVLANPAATITGLPAALCPSDPAATLTGTPAGGSFSGTGVTGNSFNPNGLANGNYTVTYSVNGACGLITTTASVAIQTNPVSSISGLPANLCPNSSPVTLTGAPAGGTFSGQGITGNVFDPSAVPTGTAITITYSGSGNCGPFSSTANVTVTPPPAQSFTPLPAVLCPNSPPVTLAATPAGGVFSGAGVTGNTFNPNGLADGNYTVTYSGNDGCAPYSLTQTTSIQSNPTASITGLPPALCANDAAVTLTGTPAGGTFSGAGVTGNSFNPNGLADGNYTVTYSVNGSCGAFSTTATVVVQTNPAASFTGLPAQLCDNQGAANLTGTPAGGTFSGTGVTGNQFVPNGLTTGNYDVTYTFNGPCGPVSSTQTIVVINASSATFSGLPANACPENRLYALNGTPAGGAFSGPGIVGNNFNANNLQPGVYDITYTAQTPCGTVAQTQSVQVVAPPTASFVATNNCVSLPVAFDAAASANAQTYFWDFDGDGNNDQVSTNANASHSFSIDGVYTIRLIVESADGCQDTTFRNVTLSPGPVAHFSLTPKACQKTTQTLEFDGTMPVGTQVSWQIPGATIVSGSGIGPYVLRWNNPGVYTVSLTLTQGGCSSNYTQQIEIEQVPVVDAGNDVLLCKGETVNLSGAAILISNASGCSYEWTTDPGALPGSASAPWLDDPAQLNPNASPLQTITYYLRARCGDCYSNLDSVKLIVRPRPTILTDQSEYRFCAGTAGAEIAFNIANGTPGYNIQFHPPTGIATPNNNISLANPTDTTVYKVVVVDASGCPSDTAQFTVYPIPVPIADAGRDALLCEGAQGGVQLNGSATGGGFGSYVYQWVPADGLSDPNIFNPYATPDTTTIYQLIVTSNQTGCSSIVNTLDTLQTVVVNVVPKPIANAAPTDTIDICPGESVQLGDLPTNVYGDTVFVWTPTDGLSNPNINRPVASPAFTTTYQLTVYTQGCSSDADRVTVRVNPRPTVAAPPVLSVCPGDSVQINATVSGAPGPYTYLWSPPDGLSDPTAEDPKASPAQTTTYTFTAFYRNCASPESQTVLVQVNPKATINLNPAGRSYVICPHENPSIPIDPSVNTGGLPYTFTWSPGAGLCDSTQLSTCVKPSETTTYTLTVRLGECEFTETLTVQVMPLIAAEISGDRDTICQGQTVRLTGKGGQGAASYVWTWNDPVLGAQQIVAPEIDANPSVTTTYSLNVTESACKSQQTYTLYVIPGASPNFVYSSPASCEGLNVGFVDQSTGTVNYYEWDFGDGSAAANEANPRHQYLKAGRYIVTLTVGSESGCVYNKKSAEIVVGATGYADYLTNPMYPVDSLILPEAKVQFIDSSAGAVSWQWTFGDGSTSVEQNPAHVYRTEGVYYPQLHVVDAHGCVYEVTHGPVRVVPPTLELPNVFTPGDGNGYNDFWPPRFYDGRRNYDLVVFDRWGIEIFRSDAPEKVWFGTLSGGSAAPAGVYFYRLKLDERTYNGSVTLLR